MKEEDLNTLLAWIDAPRSRGEKRQHRHVEILSKGRVHLRRELGGTKGCATFMNATDAAEAVRNKKIHWFSVEW